MPVNKTGGYLILLGYLFRWNSCSRSWRLPIGGQPRVDDMYGVLAADVFRAPVANMWGEFDV